jgi:hypothetical protein
VKGDNVFRCDFCGRFYSSPLPDGSACPQHIYDHNQRQESAIKRFNERLRRDVATNGATSNG